MELWRKIEKIRQLPRQACYKRHRSFLWGFSFKLDFSPDYYFWFIMLLNHLKYLNVTCKVASIFSSFLLRWDPKARRMYHVDNFDKANKRLTQKSYLQYGVTVLLLIQTIHSFTTEAGKSLKFFDKFICTLVILYSIGPAIQRYSIQVFSEHIRLYINGIIEFSEIQLLRRLSFRK